MWRWELIPMLSLCLLINIWWFLLAISGLLFLCIPLPTLEGALLIPLLCDSMGYPLLAWALLVQALVMPVRLSAIFPCFRGCFQPGERFIVGHLLSATLVHIHVQPVSLAFISLLFLPQRRVSAGRFAARLLLCVLCCAALMYYFSLLPSNVFTWALGILAAHTAVVMYCLLAVLVGIVVIVFLFPAGTRNRKVFHALVAAVLVPPLLVNQNRNLQVVALGSIAALCLLFLVELGRAYVDHPVTRRVSSWYAGWLDPRDSGPIAVTHLFLLIGCGAPVVIADCLRAPAIQYVGIAAVAVGDSLAELVGTRYGSWKWTSNTKKSVQGSLAMFVGMLASLLLLNTKREWIPMTVAALLTSYYEASTTLLDNLVLPIYAVAVYRGVQSFITV